MALPSKAAEVTGRVVDVRGDALAGARIVLSRGDRVIAETTTGADGAFSFAPVPAPKARKLAPGPPAVRRRDRADCLAGRLDPRLGHASGRFAGSGSVRQRRDHEGRFRFATLADGAYAFGPSVAEGAAKWRSAPFSVRAGATLHCDFTAGAVEQ